MKRAIHLAVAAAAAASLAACGGGGNGHQFVVNAMTMPASRSQYAVDLNGDGKPDNALGSILPLLRLEGLDTQAGIDASIKAGDTLVLLDLHTTDPARMQDAQAGVTMALGKAQPMPDLGGGGSFQIDGAEPPAELHGALQAGTFSSEPPATTTRPATVSVRLPLVAGAAAVPLKVNGAHVQFALAAGGLMTGQLNGSVKTQDLQQNIIPAIAALLTARLAMDPASASSRLIRNAFDIGDGNGGACTNPDNSMGQPGDGKIGYCEVLASPLVSTALAPDVQIFDANGNYAPDPANKKPDSLSLGVAFTAAGASF